MEKCRPHTLAGAYVGLDSLFFPCDAAWGLIGLGGSPAREAGRAIIGALRPFLASGGTHFGLFNSEALQWAVVVGTSTLFFYPVMFQLSINSRTKGTSRPNNTRNPDKYATFVVLNTV